MTETPDNSPEAVERLVGVLEEAVRNLSGLQEVRSKEADFLRALSAENEALRAEVERLRGDVHWLAEDPEQPLECWSDPVTDKAEADGHFLRSVEELRVRLAAPAPRQEKDDE